VGGSGRLPEVGEEGEGGRERSLVIHLLKDGKHNALSGGFAGV